MDKWLYNLVQQHLQETYDFNCNMATVIYTEYHD